MSHFYSETRMNEGSTDSMLSFEEDTLYWKPRGKFIFTMPRVVPDQRMTFENDELFRKLSRECEVKYTGFRDRPFEERQLRFQAECREGRADLAFVPTGTNLTLTFSPNSWSDRPEDRIPTREFVDFDVEPGKVHLKSQFILNGVCVIWLGWVDLSRLDGVGCLAFDEERAQVEDAILREQVEQNNRRVQEFEERRRRHQQEQERQAASEAEAVRRKHRHRSAFCQAFALYNNKCVTLGTCNNHRVSHNNDHNSRHQLARHHRHRCSSSSSSNNSIEEKHNNNHGDIKVKADIDEDDNDDNDDRDDDNRDNNKKNSKELSKCDSVENKSRIIGKDVNDEEIKEERLSTSGDSSGVSIDRLKLSPSSKEEPAHGDEDMDVEIEVKSEGEAEPEPEIEVEILDDVDDKPPESPKKTKKCEVFWSPWK